MSNDKKQIKQGIFDTFTTKRIQLLYEKEFIDELTDERYEGKESVVYVALHNNTKYALKIFRTTSAYFTKLKEYLVHDKRFSRVKNQRKAILYWANKEFRNLSKIHKCANNLCPRPIKLCDNILLLEHIDGEILKNTTNVSFNLWNQIKEKLYILVNKVQLVHGDLSEYNIIVTHNGDVIFIDVSQALSLEQQEQSYAYHLLERDIHNIIAFFKKKLPEHDWEQEEALIVSELLPKKKFTTL